MQSSLPVLIDLKALAKEAEMSTLTSPWFSDQVKTITTHMSTITTMAQSNGALRKEKHHNTWAPSLSLHTWAPSLPWHNQTEPWGKKNITTHEHHQNHGTHEHHHYHGTIKRSTGERKNITTHEHHQNHGTHEHHQYHGSHEIGNWNLVFRHIYANCG